VTAPSGSSSARWRHGCGSQSRRPDREQEKSGRAILYAVDRDFAKEVIWNGLGKVATGPSASDHQISIPTRCRNIPSTRAKAKALLKEAGYNGEKIRLMPLPYGETWQRWG